MSDNSFSVVFWVLAFAASVQYYNGDWPFRSSDPSEQTKAFEKKVSKNRIGSGADVWIEKFNFGSEWEKTALVFGYIDDWSFCQDVVTLYMQKYPVDRYRCVTAN